jgi:outer membrane protein assembly factor BamB
MSVLVGVTVALGQPLTETEVLARISLPGESRQIARRLLAADQLAAEKKWGEAVAHYERILHEGGNDLVPVDPHGSVQARWLCHQRLAHLPPEALRLYRAHVDIQAKRWLDQGMAAHDPEILRHLAEETFCSRYTDQALDLLGDLAFERGAFDEADYWWRLLAVPASEKDRPIDGDGLTFPDPRIDVARVRAKQILALLFRGRPAAAAEEWRAFRQLHADASGELAGRKGNYAQAVYDLIAAVSSNGGRVAEPGWVTFAGDLTRNFVAAELRPSWSSTPGLNGATWRVPLSSAWRHEPSSEESKHPLRDARGLIYYPVIADSKVLVSDGRSIRAYELTTGRLTLRYPPQSELSEEEPEAASGLRGRRSPQSTTPLEPAYTLTVDGGRLYARLGTGGIGAGKENSARSFLVCLDPRQSNPAALVRWTNEPGAAEKNPMFFEGSPIKHGGSVCIAMTGLVGVQTITWIACYDAETGMLRWRQEVCSTQELRDGERRYRHHLLTLAGPNIVYCSHSGAIVALDAVTGRRVWGLRYLSRGPKAADGNLSPRSLTPCLYDAGRLYVAPADYDRILCLDAATGRPLWESSPLEVIHLLGVAERRLIFSSMTPRGCLRALDALDGRDVAGWVSPWSGKLTPFGRGLLAGNLVLWPTWEGSGHIYVLDQATAEVVQVAPGIRGNLALANGCLVAADLDTLSAYIPERLLSDTRPGRDSARMQFLTR